MLWFMGSQSVGHNSRVTELIAGKDWGQEGKGTTEDEMAGWHHRLDERGFE